MSQGPEQGLGKREQPVGASEAGGHGGVFKGTGAMVYRGIGGGSGEGAATPEAVGKLWWEQTDSRQEMEGEAEHVSMEDGSCFNR